MIIPAFDLVEGCTCWCTCHPVQSHAGLSSGDGGSGLVLCIISGDMWSEWNFLDALRFLSNSTGTAVKLRADMIIEIFSPEISYSRCCWKWSLFSSSKLQLVFVSSTCLTNTQHLMPVWTCALLHQWPLGFCCDLWTTWVRGYQVGDLCLIYRVSTETRHFTANILIMHCCVGAIGRLLISWACGLLWLAAGLSVAAWWQCGLVQNCMWLEAGVVWPKNRLDYRQETVFLHALDVWLWRPFSAFTVWFDLKYSERTVFLWSQFLIFIFAF